MKTAQFILNLLFLPLFIYGAKLVVTDWKENKPKREIRKPKVVLPRVAFVEASPSDFTPIIRTFGTSRSYYETQIASQVAGAITAVSPVFDVGQSVVEGELLLEIEAADFLIAIAQSEAALAQAEEALAEEKTLSRIAAEDWVASGRDLTSAPEYTLRKPQLEAAQAGLKSSESSLQQARLNLERTRVRAPFNALITERLASPGNIVSAGISLGRLISSEKAEVRIPLTPEQIKLAALPSTAPHASANPVPLTVTSSALPEASWQASLVRTEPAVDPQNQVLFYIAEVEHPFRDPSQFLPLGAFLNIELSGELIPDCYPLPSTALVEDRFVWLIDEDDTLRHLSVERVFTEDEQVLLKIENPPAIPLRIATRPLVSFREGQTVEPTDGNAATSTPQSP